MSIFDDLKGLLPGGGGGGGGQANVKSPTTTTVTPTTASTGQSAAFDGGQAISGITAAEGASIVLTDQTTVNRSFNLADRAFDSVEQAYQGVTEQLSAAFKDAQQQAGAVNADTLLRLGLGAAVVLGLAFVFVTVKR